MANYIDQEELQEHFVEWLKADPDGQNMPDEIGKAILLVTNNTIRRWNFSGYTQDWKEDMVDEAIWNCVKGCKGYQWWKYSNPHAYLTMVCFRSFTSIIKKRKREQERKFEMVVDEIDAISCSDQFAEIDPQLMNDFYEKANLQVSTHKTKQTEVLEWLEAEGGVADFMDLENIEESA